MTIDRNEAAAALKSVDSARRRTGTLRGYSHSGAVVTGWGIVWLVCNLLAQFFPWGGTSWLVGVPAGIAWTLYRARGERSDWRVPIAILFAFGFLWIATLVLHDGMVDPRTLNMLVSLLVATAYLVAGLWVGLRYLLLGAAVTAVLLLGWFAFPHWLYLWLGLGGGGALIVGGLWMRQA